MSAVVTLVGRIGQDPETTATANGMTIARLSVATESRHKSRDGKWEGHTTWWRVVVFGQQADYAGQHLSKGDLVEVSGIAALRPWTGKDGSERQSLEVEGKLVSRINTGNRDGAAPAQRAAPAQANRTSDAAPAAYDGDEPPF